MRSVANQPSAAVRRACSKANDVLARFTADLDADSAISELLNKPSAAADEDQPLIADLLKVLGSTEEEKALVARLSRDAKCSFRLADNGWRLLIDIEPAVGQGINPTYKAIFSALERKGITRGIDTQAIERAVRQAAAGEKVDGMCLVVGERPVPGVDGSVEYYLRPGYGLDPETYLDASQLPENIAKRICTSGDVIARRKESVAGRPGFTAMGRDVPPPDCSDRTLVAGENVRLEGNDLIAEIDGAVVIGDAVSVRPLLVIEHDLNGPDDSIDFDGEVHIKGAVGGGATLRATGDITASTTVGDGEVISTSGSVFLKQGVSGAGRGIIRAAFDIHARFAERATLYANQDIRVEVGTISSRLFARRNIDAAKGRGRIVGGTLVAAELIRANQIGNETHSKVGVFCGMNAGQIDHLAKIETKRSRLEDRIATAQEAADGIKRMVGDVATLDDEQKATYGRLLQVVMLARMQLRDLESQSYPELDAAESAPNGRIEVLREIFPGCSIELHGMRMAIETTYRSSQFVVRDDETKITGI